MDNNIKCYRAMWVRHWAAWLGVIFAPDRDDALRQALEHVEESVANEWELTEIDMEGGPFEVYEP